MAKVDLKNKSIEFKVWIIIRDDNELEVVDSHLSVDEKEYILGPYRIMIPIPKMVRDVLEERATLFRARAEEAE